MTGLAAYRVRIFNEVIHAIVSNPSRLLSTVFLGAIAMWSFMLLGIAFFWNDYSFDSGSQWNEVCDSFKSCFGCVGLVDGLPWSCFGRTAVCSSGLSAYQAGYACTWQVTQE